MRVLVAALAAILLANSDEAVACSMTPRTAAGVRSTEETWVSALERKDRAALECILDPSFVDTNWRGQRVTRDEVLGSIPERSSAVMTLSDVEIAIFGNIALARGVNSQTSATASGSVRFTDVFVYRRGGWRAISAQETLIQPQR